MAIPSRSALGNWHAKNAVRNKNTLGTRSAGNSNGLIWSDEYDDWIPMSADSIPFVDDRLDESEVLGTVGEALNNKSAETAANSADDVAKAASKGKFFKPEGFFDDASGKLKGFYDKAASPELDYNFKRVKNADGSVTPAGVQAYGKNIGKAMNWANALYQGYNAAQGLQRFGEAGDVSNELMADILASSYNSPTIQYDLTADQLDTLRDLRRGDYDNSVDLSDIDLLGTLGDAAMGALTGIGGGLPGVVIGGIGGAANSVIDDLGNARNANNAELEALYNAVLASEQQHNALKRQRAYAML